MGSTLMNCCKPEQVGEKEYGKMLKRIQVLEDGGVPAKEEEAGGLKDKREELREKSIRGFLKQVRHVRCYGAKRIVESRWREGVAGQRSVA